MQCLGPLPSGTISGMVPFQPIGSSQEPSATPSCRLSKVVSWERIDLINDSLRIDYFNQYINEVLKGKNVDMLVIGTWVVLHQVFRVLF